MLTIGPRSARAALSFAFIAPALLTGCVSWNDATYRPTLPEYTELPFVDQTWSVAHESAKQNGRQKPSALTLDDYKDSLRVLLRDVMKSLKEKNDQNWNNGLTTLLGTTGAAVGALAGKTGLTNTGIGVAAGGQIAQNHYTPEAVRDIHLDAHTKLACISTEIGNLSEFQRRWALNGSSEEGRLAASSALFTISHAVDGVLADYRQRLLGKSPPAPNTQDMIRFLEAYKAQADVADKAATAAKADVDAATTADKKVPVDTTSATGLQIPASNSAGAVPQAADKPASAAAFSGDSAKSTGVTQPGNDDRPPKETRGKLPEEVTDPAERRQYVASGSRYAVRFVTLSTRLEACRRLGTP